jgi:hypothetical protein
VRQTQLQEVQVSLVGVQAQPSQVAAVVAGKPCAVGAMHRAAVVDQILARYLWDVELHLAVVEVSIRVCLGNFPDVQVGAEVSARPMMASLSRTLLPFLASQLLPLGFQAAEQGQRAFGCASSSMTLRLRSLCRRCLS